MPHWFLTYSYPLPPPGLLSAYVLEDGTAELEATGEPVSIVDGHHGEIGIYRHGFDQATSRRLRTLVEAAIAEAPVEEQVFPAGSLLFAFGVGSGKKVQKIVSFPLNGPLPSGTAQFQAEMVKLLRELLKHPVRAVRGSAQWKPMAEKVEGKLTLAIRVLNSGREVVEIRHPAAAKRDPAGLRIDLVADKHWRDLKPQDRAFIEVRGEEVRDIKTPSPKQLAVLEPGESLELEVTVQRQVFLSPGRYRAMIRFESGSKKASRDRRVDGTLLIVPPVLSVLPPSR